MTEDKEDTPSAPRVQSRRVTKIKAQRFRMGYTQADMARKLGITQATYNRIENQVDQTTDKRLEQIAEILGLSKDELFDEIVAYETDEGTYLQGLVSSSEKTRRERAPLHKTFQQEVEQSERINPRDIPILLKELKDLADAGVITPDEFEAKKKDLLARL